MSPETWVIAGLLVLLAIALFGLVRVRRDMKAQEVRHRKEMDQVLDAARRWGDLKSLYREHPRYQVRVIDWGPDFTGTDGTLYRYRWLVEDADKAFRYEESGEVVGVTVPHMLGNEPTRLGAWLTALGWIEKQQHPALIFTMSDKIRISREDLEQRPNPVDVVRDEMARGHLRTED